MQIVIAGCPVLTLIFFSRLKQPQARKMLQEGVIVALGSDFNPNAYCFSMVRYSLCILHYPQLLTVSDSHSSWIGLCE